MPAIVTKDSLNTMLQSADRARRAQIIGRALVALFQRQTDAEKNADTTQNLNGIGFASNDARSGSLSAKSFIRSQTLQDWQVDLWMRPTHGYPRICKYARQLNEIAEERAAQQRSRLQTALEQAKYELGMALDSDDPAIVNPLAERVQQIEQRIAAL